ncbi:MAG: acyl carrier protein [Lachnospiraceae bacterium]|nr:acyl carrier protein [Lachnospiraceae bacterium]MBR6485705.1 acyl carrier protein [Lachnospiraceae bacterium]
MSTQERLQEVFRDVFDDEEIIIGNETTADDIEGWDSLSHVALIVAVQDEFDIKFSIVETSALKNVGDFIKLIDNKIEGK